MQSSQLLSAPDIANPAYHWAPLSSHSEQPDSIVSHWLQDEGSLTKQLLALSDNDFRVKLVKEEWITLNALALSKHFGPVSEHHRFWSRKVELWGKGQPWVAAHTLIPEHSFSSPLQQVMALQTKPLGEYLFSHKDLLRGEMEFILDRSNGWGRRSVFFLFSKPIMVAEFFLPALITELAATS